MIGDGIALTDGVAWIDWCGWAWCGVSPIYDEDSQPPGVMDLHQKDLLQDLCLSGCAVSKTEYRRYEMRALIDRGSARRQLNVCRLGVGATVAPANRQAGGLRGAL